MRQEKREPENAEYYFGDAPDWFIEDQPWYMEEDEEEETGPEATKHERVVR